MGKKRDHPKKFEDYFILALILPIILLLLWELAGKRHWINMSLFPVPSRIARSFLKQVENGKLTANIMISLKRVGMGYLLGVFLGVGLGVLFGLYPKINHLFSLIMEIIRPIPIIAWVPVLIMWLGIGETSKVVAIIIGSFWSIFLNTYDGVRNVSSEYLEVAAMFRKSKWVTVSQVILPAALPSIFTGLRLGIGSAWVSVIGAELIAASAGLGFMISYSREMAQPANMYVAVLVIGIIGYLINGLIRCIERNALKWNK